MQLHVGINDPFCIEAIWLAFRYCRIAQTVEFPLFSHNFSKIMSHK